jgi:hypothetical protein
LGQYSDCVSVTCRKGQARCEPGLKRAKSLDEVAAESRPAVISADLQASAPNEGRGSGKVFAML